MLFFFVDGLGLGINSPDNPAVNLLDGIIDIPFSIDSVPSEFPDGILMALDATGGIPGLPQSASGQASLVTGKNIPAILGYHLTAMPNDTIKRMILDDCVMKKLGSRGLTVTASNLYTREFFTTKEKLQNIRGHNTFPVSTLSVMSAGVPFRFSGDYKTKRAVFSDLTNRFLKERGMNIDLIEPEEAARNMANILLEADFVYHEYFATDTYAHKKQRVELDRAILEINRFLRKLLGLIDLTETIIVLVSDHGNCEDAKSADHNTNYVPLLVFCKDKIVLDIFRKVKTLHEVRHAIEETFPVRK